MDRVIAITGASAGIGRATAIRLARDGAALAICARRRDPLDETAADIIKAGGQALPIVADVTKEADMNAFVAQAVERFGRLDVMICNAGFGIYGAIDQIAPEGMRRLLDINVIGKYAARAALRFPASKQARHHHLVDCGTPRPAIWARPATKFAQVGLAECRAGSWIPILQASSSISMIRILFRDGGVGTAVVRRDATGCRRRRELIARAIESRSLKFSVSLTANAIQC